MSNTPPDNAVEQRRKVLKGALAASGVVAMGYSGSALASFQCVTSTTAFNLDGFKKTIDASSNWAWLKLQVFNTNKGNENQGNWRAVKIPKGSNPSDADSDVNTTSYFFQDNDENDNSPPLLPDGVTNPPNGIAPQGMVAGQYAYVVIYFDTEGSIAGFFRTYPQSSGTGYPAQGSCLTSLNPGMFHTNISYGG